MTPDELQILLIVQEKDTQITRMKRELISLPEQRELITHRLEQFKRKAKEAKQLVLDTEQAIHDTEHEIETKRQLIDKMKIQQGETRKNDEYQRFNTEIAKAESIIDTLETRALELMDSLENARQKATQTIARYKEVRTSVEEELARLERTAEKTQAALQELIDERNKIASTINPDIVSTYERMSLSKGLPVIVSMDDRGRCSGCHMELTRGTHLKVQSGKEVAHCENCGRILY